MKVTPGSTDVTTYFVLRLAADGTEATGLTITNIDLQYTRSGVAPAAKVDATALAATDSAHSDNKAIEIDATDQPGLYRVDWPDAAFAAGVREVILSVKCATCFTEHLRVELETLQTGDSFARLGAAGAGLTAIPWNSAWDAEVQSEVDDALVAQNLDHLVKSAVDTNFATTVHQDSVIGQIADNGGGFDRTTDSLEAIRDRGDAAWITATGFSTHSAADVWSVATRSLTIIDEDGTTLDLDATIRAAIGLAAANLDTQLAALPTAEENADQVWEEAIADHSGTVGSTAEALNAAGAAGDPWTTALPGAYGAGSAGNIIGNNLNATITSRMATYTQPTGFLAATFPSGTVANTTNITAGTITTVTNLTNAATSGDFTATMKTSIGTAVAASAVASVTAPVTVGTNNDKTGYRLSATGVDDLHDETVEGSYTLRQYMRLFAAALLGKASGLETTNAIYRDTGDSVNRIDATVDVDGNRTSVTLDAS